GIKAVLGAEPDMRPYLLPGFALCWMAAHSASAADLKLLPADISLRGPDASQRLIVLSEEGGHFVGDLTGLAKWTSSNLAVATVDGSGMVRAAGDGEAILTAKVDGQQVTAKVQVANARDPITPSFRNHVI